MKPTEKAHDVFQTGCRTLSASGEPEYCARIARRYLQDCELCARYCHVDRLQTIQGAVCRIGARAVVYSYGSHRGEEDVLRGWNGSGEVTCPVSMAEHQKAFGIARRLGLDRLSG